MSLMTTIKVTSKLKQLKFPAHFSHYTTVQRMLLLQWTPTISLPPCQCVTITGGFQLSYLALVLRYTGLYVYLYMQTVDWLPAPCLVHVRISCMRMNERDIAPASSCELECITNRSIHDRNTTWPPHFYSLLDKTTMVYPHTVTHTHTHAAPSGKNRCSY